MAQGPVLLGVLIPLPCLLFDNLSGSEKHFSIRLQAKKMPTGICFSYLFLITHDCGIPCENSRGENVKTQASMFQIHNSTRHTAM